MRKYKPQADATVFNMAFNSAMKRLKIPRQSHQLIYLIRGTNMKCLSYSLKVSYSRNYLLRKPTALHTHTHTHKDFLCEAVDVRA